jgi:hypothetical protein
MIMMKVGFTDDGIIWTLALLFGVTDNNSKKV